MQEAELLKKKIVDFPFYDGLFYTTFNEYPDDYTKIRDLVNNVDVSSPVSKTTDNALIPGRSSGVFTGTQSVSLTLQPVGTGDFTLESWFWFGADLSGVYIMMSNMSNATGGSRISLGVNVGKFYTPTAYGVNRVSSLVPKTNDWNHGVLMRKDGTCYQFLNGIRGLSWAYPDNVSITTYRIGSYINNARYYNGLISDSALCKIARYPIGGFEPPYPLVPSLQP